jgi:hypothetical protein
MKQYLSRLKFQQIHLYPKKNKKNSRQRYDFLQVT